MYNALRKVQEIGNKNMQRSDVGVEWMEVTIYPYLPQLCAHYPYVTSQSNQVSELLECERRNVEVKRETDSRTPLQFRWSGKQDTAQQRPLVIHT